MPRMPQTLIVILLCVGTAGARTEVRDGELDLEITGLPEAPVVLTMTGAELAAGPAGDEATAALLRNVTAVHLRQYPSPDAGIVEAAQALPAQLTAADWELARQQVSDGRQVSLHVRRTEAGSVAGLLLLIVDPDKLVAIANIVGDIPPAQLGQLGLPLTH